MEPHTFLLPALALFSLVATTFAKVPVTVYYESLCPDSRYFVRSILGQQYSKIADKIDLTFVPFGKARSLPNGNFQCQHGPRECRGNMLQACALSQLSKGKTQMDYVYCAMDRPGYNDKQCIEEAGLNYSEIENCMQNSLGRELLMNHEMDTISNTPAPAGKDRGPSFVPTIVLNKVYNDDDQNTAFSDMELAVCKYTVC
ncbi:unnamed protein product [Bemisia tabaci]|uniref:Gamma-interferon inducible lysosomal thiol reductase n=1 Tax=Bemisia tabaci TaxID=7038 RepID=A0A9P0F518_BEMTA|nr:PREDICTED: GILT-like protein C02D5.2 [Bemisia tabaci]CAH0388376.1 unnamed protein product [Bemisia tabaci]